MATQDTVDPSVREADQRSARAKESLLKRVELLKHKLSDVRHRFDPQEQITKHPLPAVGLAFALGVIAGLGRGRAGQGEGARSSLTGAALAGLTAVAMRVVREMAMAQLGQAAHRWWTTDEGMSPSEVRSSRTPAVESFLDR